MDLDHIFKTPGCDRLLAGAIIFGLGLLVYKAFEYQMGIFLEITCLLVMAYGAIKFGHGLFTWKYAHRDEFLGKRSKENLLVDIPLNGKDTSMLLTIEDALIEQVRNSNLLSHDGHSIDAPNEMGTIHLCGLQADAMFAQVYATLSRFALPNGLHLFPREGQPIDTVINGKRVLIDLPSLELSR